jgi:hypothetical protein
LPTFGHSWIELAIKPSSSSRFSPVSHCLSLSRSRARPPARPPSRSPPRYPGRDIWSDWSRKARPGPLGVSCGACVLRACCVGVACGNARPCRPGRERYHVFCAVWLGRKGGFACACVSVCLCVCLGGRKGRIACDYLAKRIACDYLAKLLAVPGRIWPWRPTGSARLCPTPSPSSSPSSSLDVDTRGDKWE